MEGYRVELQDTEAKGRNGWFRASVADATALTLASRGDHVVLDVKSKRQGNNSPITMYLSPQDAVRLAMALLKSAIDASTATADGIRAVLIQELEREGKLDGNSAAAGP